MELPADFFVLKEQKWRLVLYGISFPFCACFWTSFREDKHFCIFFVVYLVILLIWSFRQGVRFVYPIMPIYFYFALKSISNYFDASRGRIVIYFWVTCAVLFASAMAASSIFHRSAYFNLATMRKSNVPGTPFSRHAYQAYNFIINETPPDAFIIFHKPRVLYMMTKRLSFTSNHGDSENWRGDYILINKMRNRGFKPDKRIKKEFENGEFVLWKVIAPNHDAISR